MPKRNFLRKEIIRHRYFYLMLIPAAAFYIIFCYGPIYGILLAFKDYHVNMGIIGSPWVGLQNFADLLRLQDFRTALFNTITISFERILVEFPAPIILALMLNEVGNSRFKKFFQTVYTFPNFLSWIVVSGIAFSILGADGVLNQLVLLLGGKQTALMTDPNAFRPILFISSIWKSAGYYSIIYLAAIAGINPELYEAARMDGANRFQQICHITWPCIRSTVTVMLILAVGNMMSAGLMSSGFDQIFNMYNPAVYGTADVIDTFIFRRTFMLGANFGSSTAVGLFRSVLNVTLLLIANTTVKRIGEEGIV